jgi:hypothetical protein
MKLAPKSTSAASLLKKQNTKNKSNPSRSYHRRRPRFGKLRKALLAAPKPGEYGDNISFHEEPSDFQQSEFLDVGV